MSKLGYTKKDSLIPEGCVLFSASSLNSYYSNTSDFFKRVFKLNDENYTTTSMVLGTVIHHFASNYNKDFNEIEKEVLEYLEELKFNPYYDTIDTGYIESKYPSMAIELINYINSYSIIEPTEVETSYTLKLSDRVYLAGTIDCRYDNLLLDYKTTSNKYISPDTPIPNNYKYQLYTYLHLLHRNNIKIDKCGITWISVPETNRYSEKTGKQLKDYPCKIVTNEEYIDFDLYDQVWEEINLVANNIEFILDHPDSLYLFAKDLSLKDINLKDKLCQ